MSDQTYAVDIFRAFKPYYDKTELAEPSDPAILETLTHELDQEQVYYWSEVEAFAQVFYKPAERQGATGHAHMQRHLQPAVDRFKALDDEERGQAFRDKLAGYDRGYAFLSQIVPYADSDLEMLYSYGRFLLPHLPRDRDAAIVQVGDEVALQYYRLERVFSSAIEVKEGEAQYVKSPTEVGTGATKDEPAPLSEIIEVLNERFGTQFAEEDRLFFQQIKEKACNSELIVRTALANLGVVPARPESTLPSPSTVIAPCTARKSAAHGRRQDSRWMATTPEPATAPMTGAQRRNSPAALGAMPAMTTITNPALNGAASADLPLLTVSWTMALQRPSGGDLLVGKSRNPRSCRRMLYGDGADISVMVQIEQRVVVEIACLGDRDVAKLDVQRVRFGVIPDIHGLNPLSKKALCTVSPSGKSTTLRKRPSASGMAAQRRIRPSV